MILSFSYRFHFIYESELDYTVVLSVIISKGDPTANLPLSLPTYMHGKAHTS